MTYTPSRASEFALNLSARTDLPVASTVAIKFAHTVAIWGDRTKMRRAVGRLSDAHLRDIGITPTQAQIEAQKPFWKA
ncbi:hypothetical protein GCM10007939_12340 [Amylibacter marinus]|uniref:YjiS-like domain-containing protein n=1 Tax=Amylibacter marinus TaxID=1475483 RepID=A0ABQ5VU71_9RHOB|nr:DUF1127 domain-containing protein [Amylibacter marinus]GLQ34951.1 hypothetical protein GCM10007939_12340 [Amylibacter marinus]